MESSDFALGLTGGFAQSPALRADLHARIQDLLARKDLPFLSQIEGVLRLTEMTLSRDHLRQFLRAFLGRFHREEPLGEERTAEEEWRRLADLIRQAGRDGTIESYSSYLFPVALLPAV